MCDNDEVFIALSLSLVFTAGAPLQDARDERASLEARLSALATLQKEDPKAAALIALRVESARGRERARAKVITRLAALDVDVAGLQRADRAFATIRKLRKRQHKDSTLSRRKQGLIKSAIKSWRAYRSLDPVREGQAMLELAALYEHVGDLARAHRVYKSLGRFRARSRDASPVRHRAHRARAKLLEADGKWREAARESFRADLELKAIGPSADEVKARTYRRTRATADLCARASENGVSCARLQGKARTFYDFSVEKTYRFSKARAAVVNNEFGDLLARCVHENARHARGTTVQVDWDIGLDGRVKNGRIYRPTRLRATPMGACLSEAFEKYRYPRYSGEVQHSMLEWYIPERG